MPRKSTKSAKKSAMGNRYPEATRKKAIDIARNEGATARAIAERLGVKHSAVGYWLHMARKKGDLPPVGMGGNQGAKAKPAASLTEIVPLREAASFEGPIDAAIRSELNSVQDKIDKLQKYREKLLDMVDMLQADS